MSLLVRNRPHKQPLQLGYTGLQKPHSRILNTRTLASISSGTLCRLETPTQIQLNPSPDLTQHNLQPESLQQALMASLTLVP